MTATKAKPPEDLQVRGKTFWSVTVDVFELNESETRLLHEACRILDELDALKTALDADGVTVHGSAGQPVAHPCLAAMSSHRSVLGRLLAQLNLPYDADDSAIQSPAQIRARRAAKARWKPKAV